MSLFELDHPVPQWIGCLSKTNIQQAYKMQGSSGLIIGISIGVVIGILLAFFGLFCFRYQRKQLRSVSISSSRRAAALPIRTNGVDTCTIMSDSTLGPESPTSADKNSRSVWFDGFRKSNVIHASGILEYSYKDLQKATQNFTTMIGQGAFGPVYKAQMLTGEIVAVKVLATYSKQGEREFQMEVKLLGRLHHRNLLNLVGYCAEKGKNMLIYVYMSHGSLASHLYDENKEPLSWDLRVYIALDVARGLEYLHDGAAPPVIHRDIKSSNILLDQSMRARVADFGLSREEMDAGHANPEYISTRTFTKKSDVYSYGVLLFELIAGRNPQQGLMEYVELAAINIDGGSGWEELADSRLKGEFDAKELNEVSSLAYKCISRSPKMRPSMRDIVQVLTRTLKSRHNTRKHHKKVLSATPEEVTINVGQQEAQTPLSELRRESLDSVSMSMSDARTPLSEHHRRTESMDTEIVGGMQFKEKNNSLPFNKYAYLATHNSFAINGEPLYSGTSRVTIINQDDSVTQQLHNGVRALMLDTYDYQGDVWKPAVETLKEIEAFLKSNPSEIVTLILEDYVKAPNGLSRATACKHNSGELMEMLHTCYSAAGNRWPNFVAVDYYKRSNGGGAFQAVETLNAQLLCNSIDLNACKVSDFAMSQIKV
ncbi:hypothetical protein V2J09_017577 [Rumex salicifolius]